MTERVRKLLRPWNRTDEIIQRCLDWVVNIVDTKHRRYVNRKYLVDRCG